MPQEPNFPKVQFGSVKIAEEVKDSHNAWIEIMKNNDKIMMEGKTRPTEEGNQPSAHEGKLETFLCRLIDQRSAGIITMG